MAQTLINLNNRFPTWGTNGFVPQTYDGTNQNNVTLNVYEDESGNITTDLDWWSLLPSGWQSYQAVYVDPVNGNDSNSGLTTALPKKSLDAAVNVTAVSGKIVYAMPGMYNRAQGFKARVINENTVLLPWPGTSGQIIASSRLTNNTGGATIAADSTRGVWVFSDVRGETSTTIATVYVASELPTDITNGVGRLYTLAGSVAACRTTAQSYFVVEDSDEIYSVYVNTGQTSSPDPNLLHILRDTANCAPVNGGDSAHSFFAYNVKFLGGTRPFYCATTSGTTLVRSNYAFLNCEFCFSGISAQRDGCGFSASKNVYLFDCFSHNVTRDCFSYKAFRDYTAAASFPSGTAVWNQVVEIRCRALNANTPLAITDANSLANCSSAHDYCKIIRIGCEYELARGGIIHDTNTASDYGVVASLNLGCSAADSRAASDNNAGVTDYCFGISGSSNVYGWVYRCINVDSAGNNSDSTYYIRNKASTATVLTDSNLFNTTRKDGTIGALPAFQTPR